MYRLRLFLLLSAFLVASFLSAQSGLSGLRVDSILSGPHDVEQLGNLNTALANMINNGETVSDTLFERSIAMALELEEWYFAAEMYLNRSAYDINKGNLTKSITHANKAIEIAQSSGDKEAEALSYNMKIRIMMADGKMKESADLALYLVEKYKAERNTIKEAQVYTLLSELSTNLGDFPMTLNYDSIALDLARKGGNDEVLARSLHVSAENFVLLGDPAKGLMLATEAINLAEKNDFSRAVIRNITDVLMSANIELGNYEAARENLAVMEAFGREEKFAWWMVTKGKLLQRIGRNEEARDLLLEAAGMIRATSNSPVSLRRAYVALQTVDLNEAEYDTVVHYGRLIKAQEDSLQIARNIRHLQELEEKYKAGEKESEIQLQKEKLAAQEAKLYFLVAGFLFALFAALGFFLMNQQLKKRNVENEALLRDKETLVGEIHHRVKNNLQVVSSLLQIQRRGLDFDDEKGREALQESQNRVSAMGLIHNKLYQGKEVTSVHMPDYLEDLGDTLLDAYRLEEQVEIFYDIEDILLDVDDAIPLGLIINELITNSLKYAFPKGREGTIEVSLLREEEGLKLKVSDDGVGVAAAEKRTDSTSFGRNLIGLLTQKLKGELKILEGKGYGVEVLFGQEN